jgi:WD40 repeat protein
MSTDGTHVAAMEELGNLLIFDYSGSTPVLENTVSTGTSGAFALDFSPDGTKIVTGCTNNKMNIYRVSDGDLLHTITAHNTWVMSVDWSPNGNFVVSGGSDNLVRLWDTSGMLIRTMTGHTGAVQSVRFSADGNYIISGSKDDRIKVWESATGNLVRTISGHGGDVMQVDISDNGERIVSGSADSTIRVWNFATGGQLMQFGIPSSGKVYTVDFAPDNHHVAVGTAKGDVQLWDIELPTAVADEMQPGSALQVCPNPCTESIFIAGPEAVVAFTVTDMAGKDVRGNYVSGKYFSISLAGLPQGVYVLSVLTANGNTYRRSIVKNGFN